MKAMSVVEQIECLEDQLQVVKWMVRPQLILKSLHPRSVVERTAGMLRGRLPKGSTYQRRLRREWEHRAARETSR